MEIQKKINYEELTVGYEFAPNSFRLDNERVTAYLDAVEDQNNIYREHQVVPPMSITALAMAAMSSGMILPGGTVHISQNLEFRNVAQIGETLTSYAKVNRKWERGKFHMLTIGINVLNQHKMTVLAGETCFILPLAMTEGK